MSKALIVGDTHIGKSQALGRPGVGFALNSQIIDQFKLLDWVLEQAIENDVENLIFTGDIFDVVKPDYTLVNLFFQYLKKCELHKIDIHICLGNHDLKRSGNFYSSVLDIISSSNLTHTHVYTDIQTVHYDGISFTFLPFRDRKSLECETSNEAISLIKDKLPYEIADIPIGNLKVLIGHMALEGSIFVGDEIDDAANELMLPSSMFLDYDYTIMGHIHKPQVKNQKPYVGHIGSLNISDFGEINHTKILILLDSEFPEKLIEIPIPTRPLIKINITVPNSELNQEDFILSEILKLNSTTSFKNAIIRIEVRIFGAEYNLNRKLIEEQIYNLGAFFICNFIETRNIAAVPLEKQSDVDNTISAEAAIKLWADQYQFDCAEDKKLYLEMSFGIIKELSTKEK